MAVRYSSAEKKEDCTCASIKADKDNPEVDIQCSPHPGLCILDEKGVCMKRENATHCNDVLVNSVGENSLKQKEQGTESCSENKSSRMSCNKKVHYYKIDLNNSEDTGLIADKQCQTCGSECSSAMCSSRSREFYINWDKVRTKLLLFLILLIILWLSIYSALSLTSTL